MINWHLGVCDVLYKKNPNPQDHFIDINDSDADDMKLKIYSLSQNKPTHAHSDIDPNISAAKKIILFNQSDATGACN